MNLRNQLLMNRLQQPISTQPMNTFKSNSQSLSDISNGSDFFDTLKSSVASLEESQVLSDRGIEQLVTGEAENMHQVMIQTTEAQIALEMAVQLRNKSLEAMNEIKNMQF